MHQCKCTNSMALTHSVRKTGTCSYPSSEMQMTPENSNHLVFLLKELTEAHQTKVSNSKNLSTCIYVGCKIYPAL